MKNLIHVCFAFLAMAALLTGCSSEDALEVQEAQFDEEEYFAVLEREVMTVESWEDAEDELQFGRISDSDEHLLMPNCVSKTWRIDSMTGARILTIDFGDSYCLGRDGLYRKGLIVITFVGPRGQPGATKRTEFIGYFVMDHEFNGTKFVEFQGNHTYSREVDMVLTVGSATATWYADQLVEMIAGYFTPEKHDDIFQVTGEGGGIRKSGIAYTALIVEPLLRKLQPGCHENFVDGVIEFTNENGGVSSLDYDPLGGAPCDKLAAVTRNGETHYITLW